MLYLRNCLLVLISVCVSIFLIFPAGVFAANVNPDGSFSYSIDITLPPGTNGMAPKLSLVYNSNSDNGMLGVGWSLAGLPCITRDTTHGLPYMGDGYYTGPGGRLVLINSSKGLYHYENESFCQIQESVSFGTEPSGWIETKPDGTKYYYGLVANETEGSDARILTTDESYVRVWALAKVEDLYGNYYTIIYNKDNGAYYPASITYTQNDLYLLSETRTIEFGYNEDLSTSRLDYYSNQSYGSKVEYHSLLTSINIKVGGTAEHTYSLSYDVGDTAVKSRLLSVKDSWQEGGTIEFSWKDEITQWTEEDNYKLPLSLSSDSVYIHAKLGDVNGDGLLDFIEASNGTKLTYLNDGTTFKSQSGYHLPVNYYDIDSSYPYDATVNDVDFTDINGDNFSDFIYNQKAYISNGAGWTENNKYNLISSLYSNPNSYFLNSYQVGVLSDLNGDGLIDYAISYGSVYYNSYYYNESSFLNTGSTWSSNDENYILPLLFDFFNYDFIGNSKYNHLQLVDINGDGYTDCVNLKTGDVYLNTGYGISSSADDAYKLPENLYSYSGVYKYGELADMNGDGLVDCVISYKEGSDKYTFQKTYLNTGYGFSANPASAYKLPANMFFSNTSGITDDIIIISQLIDINGDGLVGIIGGEDSEVSSSVYNHQTRVYLMTSSQSRDSLMTTITDSSGSTTGITYSPVRTFTDIVEDGATEKPIVPSVSSYPYISNISARNLV